MASIHLLGRRRHLGPVRERPKTITRFTRIHFKAPSGAFFCVRPAGRICLKVKVLYSPGKGTGSGLDRRLADSALAALPSFRGAPVPPKNPGLSSMCTVSARPVDDDTTLTDR